MFLAYTFEKLILICYYSMIKFLNQNVSHTVISDAADPKSMDIHKSFDSHFQGNDEKNLIIEYQGYWDNSNNKKQK
jgi:hypothetical protein